MFDYSKDTFFDVFCGGGSVYTNVVDKYNTVGLSGLLGPHKNGKRSKLIDNLLKIIDLIVKY